jgi:hypothetical protein
LLSASKGSLLGSKSTKQKVQNQAALQFHFLFLLFIFTGIVFLFSQKVVPANRYMHTIADDINQGLLAVQCLSQLRASRSVLLMQWTTQLL